MLIETENLWKTYKMGIEELHALRGVNVSVAKGEYLAIMGPSGSGKSTLMNLIGCLDTPSQGSYVLNGKQVSSMNDDELARIRNREIGFVFQTFNLLARATALHNVELPLIYNGTDSKTRIEMAKHALEQVDRARERSTRWTLSTSQHRLPSDDRDPSGQVGAKAHLPRKLRKRAEQGR